MVRQQELRPVLLSASLPNTTQDSFPRELQSALLIQLTLFCSVVSSSSGCCSSNVVKDDFTRLLKDDVLYTESPMKWKFLALKGFNVSLLPAILLAGLVETM